MTTICDVCKKPIDHDRAIILWDEDTNGYRSPDQWTVRDLAIVHHVRCDANIQHCSTYLTDLQDAKHYREKFSRQPFRDESERGRVLGYIREASRRLPEIAKTSILA